jgi:aminopeptidase YwaD
MKKSCAILAVIILAATAWAQMPALLDKQTAQAFANEISGETAKRNLEFISTNHRMHGSRPFHAAAEHIAAQLRSYGIKDVQIEQLPADGKIFYGTQRSRPAWDADFAELWDLTEKDGKWTPTERLASWDAVPLSLAEDSESGEAEADLIDVAAGTDEKDYAGKNVTGRFALISEQPGAAAELALKHGAVGLVSYAQNQRTAWSGDNPDQVRWGHMDTFAKQQTFAFMISMGEARTLQQRLSRGERIRLHGVVRAGLHPGTYDIVNASIPGVDPQLLKQEIVFTCHLDHPRPGANDNASGCVTILEIARTLSKLIREQKIAPPARTIRFLWPMEVEGSMAMLNAHPEWAANHVKANIHLDMVGGSPETKAVFHVTRGPASVPSFINDVAEDIAEFVNEQTYKFAATGESEFPLIAKDGGKEPLRADIARFTMGSDHEVFADSSWSIPTIYLNDWPDRNIHTNFDTAALIDPTKLKRAAFIAGTSAYLLANVGPAKVDLLSAMIHERSLGRVSDTLHRGREIPTAAQASLYRFELGYERGVFNGMTHFFAVPEGAEARQSSAMTALAQMFPAQPAESRPTGDAAMRFQRNPNVKGPMTVFGYDYFEDHYGKDRTKEIRLLKYEGLWSSGGEYAYEVLNFANGKMNVQEIRDAVSAIYGPVPLDDVLQYLKAAESIGVVERAR